MVRFFRNYHLFFMMSALSVSSSFSAVMSYGTIILDWSSLRINGNPVSLQDIEQAPNFKDGFTSAYVYGDIDLSSAFDEYTEPGFSGDRLSVGVYIGDLDRISSRVNPYRADDKLFTSTQIFNQTFYAEAWSETYISGEYQVVPDGFEIQDLSIDYSVEQYVWRDVIDEISRNTLEVEIGTWEMDMNGYITANSLGTESFELILDEYTGEVSSFFRETGTIDLTENTQPYPPGGSVTGGFYVYASSFSYGEGNVTRVPEPPAVPLLLFGILLLSTLCIMKRVPLTQ